MNNNSLLQKLELFIRKYYKNLIIKGLLLTFAWLLMLFLVMALSEYVLKFDTTFRTILFFGYISVALIILVKYIVYPILKLNKIGNRLSPVEASKIIGNHFSDVSDKLLNTLQLQELNDLHSDPLLEASILQKSAELSPIPFLSVIQYKENNKYVRWVAIPLLVIAAFLFLAPSIITESSKRILHHNEAYIPKAPYEYIIENKDLEVLQGQDFKLNVKLEGAAFPAELFIKVGDFSYKLERAAPNKFSYTFNRVNKGVQFTFFTDEFSSDAYQLKVIPKPLISSLKVRLHYPSYLGKPSEEISNAGDIQVPEGTIITWILKATNTDSVSFSLEEKNIPVQHINNEFKISWKAKNTSPYQILSRNAFSRFPDSMSYQLTVIPDLYPEIMVEEQNDSTNSTMRFFNGIVSDDYGISQLKFHFRVVGEDGKEGALQSKSLSIQSSARQTFYHYFDVSQANLQPGQALNYYFEVWDNDADNGKKSSRSRILTYKLPDFKQMEEQQEKNSESIKDQLNQSVKDVKALQQEIDKIKKSLNQKKELSWEDKKSIEEIKKKQEKLTREMKQISQLNKENLEQKKQFNQLEEQLLDKQDKLQEMMEKLLNDDMKKLMDDIQRMMEEINKDKSNTDLDKLKVDNKEVEKELDRMLSFFKQLELEEKLNKTTNKLDDLAKEQQKQAEQSQDKKSDSKDLQKKQEELNTKFDDLKKDLKEIEKENKELEDPSEKLDKLDDGADDIQKDQEESLDDIKKDNKKQASQKQKKAADKMEKMSEKLKKKTAEMEMDALQEDMQSLRRLLENLVKFSFSQEEIIKRLKDNSNYSPVYVAIAQDQFKLKDQAKLIEDSLFALSKRILQLESFINKEIGLVNLNIEKSIQALSLRNTPEVKNRQQYVMTSVNNLALMLSEIFEQMQQQMQEQKSKNKGGACKKPGSGKGKGKGKSASESLSKMSELQKQLNEQMKAMKKGMENGKEPGDKPGNRGLSSQFAQMAAQQETIRRELQRLSQELQKSGKPGGNGLDPITREMEKIEKDLVNKNLNVETLNRQQEILTRLLESEKAEKEREFDNKRESNTAKNIERNIPSGFEEYRKKKETEIELLRTVTPDLHPFYKKKVDSYFMNINR